MIKEPSKNDVGNQRTEKRKAIDVLTVTVAPTPGYSLNSGRLKNASKCNYDLGDAA